MIAIYNENEEITPKDIVTCGGGYDRVMADRRDVVAANCEQVADTQSEVNALFESISESFWAGLPFPSF